ncbi:PTS sugar transporter subunit IIC [Lentilactobacillus sp. SPB1-3]|uniref:PTS sugar transporter subunit IIC n=1 Tax=Lentilactobacillus terminaliae TaxID=3003483 RepID=A0ACD5DH53_9LACO|nr:PTS sugar transporter subunit IIC [Lentilactobacillus sp. SPB1-3]MCZ0976875.1 PTS sugar transporter subunit IIC [Lentilactobacillus sp. SPB1-3]
MLLASCLTLIVAFLAGLDGILDEWQFYQPIVTCTLIGAAFSDISTGILLGATLQIIMSGWINLASVISPDISFASVTAAIMVCGPAHLQIGQGVLVAIGAAVIGRLLTIRTRKLMVNIAHKADQAAEISKLSEINRLQWISMGIQGLRVMIPSVIVLMLSNVTIGHWFRMIPQSVNTGINAAASLIAVVGFSIIITTIESRALWIWFAGGFLIATFFKLTLTFVILLGVVLTILYIIIENRHNGKKDQSDPFSDELDDL